MENVHNLIHYVLYVERLYKTTVKKTYSIINQPHMVYILITLVFSREITIKTYIIIMIINMAMICVY